MEPYFQGWLLKSPLDDDVINPIFKFFMGKWRKRFFVLFGPPSSTASLDKPKVVLEYFQGQNLKKKRGSIDLSTCDQIMTNHKFDNFKHVISFVANHRTGTRRFFHLAAENQTAMDGWVDAINSLLGLSRGSLNLQVKQLICLSAPSIPEISIKAVSMETDLLTCFGRQEPAKGNKVINDRGDLPLASNEAPSFDHGCYDDLSFHTSVLGHSQVEMFRSSPSLPSINPRRSKFSELDVEVPLFKSDQRDSGFSGDMGDFHDDHYHHHHYYKVPRHNYNVDTTYVTTQLRQIQPQTSRFKSWYAVPPSCPDIAKKSPRRSATMLVIPEISSSNRNQELDMEIPSAGCDSINRQPLRDGVVYDVPRPGVNEITKMSRGELENNLGNAEVANFSKVPHVAWNLEKMVVPSVTVDHPQVEGPGHHDNREEAGYDNSNDRESKSVHLERSKIFETKPFSDRTTTTNINNDNNNINDNNNKTSSGSTIVLSSNIFGNKNKSLFNNASNKPQLRIKAFQKSRAYLDNFRQQLRQQNDDDNIPGDRLTNLRNSSAFSISKDDQTNPKWTLQPLKPKLESSSGTTRTF